MSVSYQITPTAPNHHLFSVSLRFTPKPDTAHILSLPAWLPGSYMIRDFSKNIVELSATDDDGTSLSLTPLDKQRWQVEPSASPITVHYQVFAFDLSVRTAYLDDQRGFFNGSSTFLSVSETEDQPCTLTINPAENREAWKVATGLTRGQNTDIYEFGEYLAQDYHQLIDCPVAIGEFDVTEFVVEGVTHYLVFTSKHYGDTARLADDVAKLCQHHISLFGEAPFTEYWFITHLQAKGFGGLEHKNSTVLQASRFDLPNPNKPDELSENYKTFLSLCSHEYFHAWNVCRIKPKEFRPYDLSQEVYTRQLWAYEGITSYYDDFSLYRAGIISFDDYLGLLSKTATRVNRGKGQLKQSVSDSSFFTWNKFYQQGPDAVNNIVSYYTKGSLIALWLDLTIRRESQGQYSLDQLMRELWIHFGRPQIGTNLEDFANIASVLCNKDISTELTHILNATETIELTDILSEFGVSWQLSKYKHLNSLDTVVSSDAKPFLGAMYSSAESGLKVTQVLEDSPAANAGIVVNDVIIAVDGIKATDASIKAIFDNLAIGTSVSIHTFRDDILLTNSLTIEDSPITGICLQVENQEKVENWQKIF